MNLFISLMRTLVPLVAGWLITLAVSLGVNLDSGVVTTMVTTLITLAYYAVFRFLENAAKSAPKMQKLFGVLLGWARPPDYPLPQSPDSWPRA